MSLTPFTSHVYCPFCFSHLTHWPGFTTRVCTQHTNAFDLYCRPCPIIMSVPHARVSYLPIILSNSPLLTFPLSFNSSPELHYLISYRYLLSRFRPAMVLPPPTFHINNSSSCISTCTLDDCETLGLGHGKSIAVACSHWVLMHLNALWFAVDVGPPFFLFCTLIFWLLFYLPTSPHMVWFSCWRGVSLLLTLSHISVTIYVSYYIWTFRTSCSLALTLRSLFCIRSLNDTLVLYSITVWFSVSECWLLPQGQQSSMDPYINLLYI